MKKATERNPKQKLTEYSARVAEWDPEGPANQWVWDAEIPGFGLRLYDSGRKTFWIRYRSPASGKQRGYRIGDWETEVSPREARKRARELRGEIAGGSDPKEREAAEREEASRREAASRTVAEILGVYLAYLKARPAAQSTIDEAERRIKSRLAPEIGEIPVSELTKARVQELHRTISEDGKAEANRCVELLRAAWNHAGEEEILPDPAPANPAKLPKKKRNRERSRDRFLKWQGERVRLLEAIEGEEDPEGKAYLRLLFLGMRKSELLKAKWEGVDLEAGVLRIARKKGGESHFLPLPPYAVEILEGLPSRGNSEWIFPSPKTGRPRDDFRAPWDRVRERAGLEDVWIHDLRRSVASWLTQRGVSREVVKLILGHAMELTVTDRYARLVGTEGREPLAALWRDLWGNGEDEASRLRREAEELRSRLAEIKEKLG